MSVKVVNNDNFQAEVLQSDVPVLVDFYADWCGPCKMMAPVIDELAAERTDIKFCKLDVDAATQVAQTYRVMSIPTFIVFKGGEVHKKAVGAIQKSDLIALFEP